MGYIVKNYLKKVENKAVKTTQYPDLEEDLGNK